MRKWFFTEGTEETEKTVEGLGMPPALTLSE